MRSFVAKAKGPSGLADIKVLPKTVKVSFVEPDEAGRPLVFEVDKLKAPANVRNGRFNAALNGDKDQLYDLLPVGGKDVKYVGTFVEIQHAKDQNPKPVMDEGRAYDFTDSRTNRPVHRVEPASRVFTMLFKILTGEFKDLVVPLRLRYLFAEDLDTNEAMVYSAIAGHPWQDWARQLLTSLRVAGLDMATDILPYDVEGEGTLIALNRVLRSKKQVVDLFIGKTGWLNKIGPGAEGVTIETYTKSDDSADTKAEGDDTDTGDEAE